MQLTACERLRLPVFPTSIYCAWDSVTHYDLYRHKPTSNKIWKPELKKCYNRMYNTTAGGEVAKYLNVDFVKAYRLLVNLFQ